MYIIHLLSKSVFQSSLLKIESEHKYSVGLYSKIYRFWKEIAYLLYNIYIYIFRTKVNIIKSIKIGKKIQVQYNLFGISKVLFSLLFSLYLKSYKYF